MKASSELVKSEPGGGVVDRLLESPIPHSYNYGVDPNAETEVHLLDYWRAVRKRLWLVISIVVLVTMLATLYVARKPDIYESGARLQVDLENNAGLVSKTPYLIGSANDPVYFNTQLQILTRGGLLRRVVKTLDLEHNPEFLQGDPGRKKSTWQTVLRMAGLSGDAKPDSDKPKNELQLR